IASSKSWLLFGILLAFTIAASWPTGTSALPRRSRGSEPLAIHKRGDATSTGTETETSLPYVHLPHRRRPHPTANPVKRFRKHRRTTRDLKSEVFPTTPRSVEEEIVEPSFRNISMIGTSIRGKCARKMSNAPLNAALLRNAFEVVQDTKEAIICLTDEWLDYTCNKTMEQALHETKLHRLYLEHPLKNEVAQVQFIDKAFEYRGEVGDVDQEMPRILAALNVLDDFVKHLKLTGEFASASREYTHKHISEKVSHNVVKALELSQLEECATPDYKFNERHATLQFAAYAETIKVLTIVERIY
ncbi:hypothetical protein KR067_000261, partial [Drosophila pandora]